LPLAKHNAKGRDGAADAKELQDSPFAIFRKIAHLIQFVLAESSILCKLINMNLSDE
jgi:hypothetical protein